MNFQYNNPDWNQRNDNVPGYIYLMESEGFHGWIPGCFLRRCKIGLSRNPQMRLQNFEMNQPPCQMKILRTVFVQDMKAAEEKLHEKFKHCQVKLKRSREFFDLNPADYLAVHAMMMQLDTANAIKHNKPMFSIVVAGLIGTLVLGGAIGQTLKTTPESQAQVQNRVERKVVAPKTKPQKPHQKPKTSTK